MDAKEQNFINSALSKGERAVYHYLKEVGTVSEPLSVISKAISSSEPTVSRAVKKLQREGVVTVVPTQGKAESNTIIFNGIPDEKEQVDSILTLVSQLTAGADRFGVLLNKKDEEIDRLRLENEAKDDNIRELNENYDQLQDAYEKLQNFVNELTSGSNVFEGRIVSVTDLGNGTSAVIINNKPS